MTSAAEPPRPDLPARSPLRGAFVGVRGRLLALVLLALVPTLGLTLFRALEDRKAGTSDAQADALEVAENASHTQAQRIVEAHQLLFGLAQLPEVRDANSEPCSQLLARIVREFPVYANLGVIVPNGDIVCSGVAFTGPVNAADRAYFRRALAEKDFAVGDYQIGRITHKATLNVAYPSSNRAGYKPSSSPLSISLG